MLAVLTQRLAEKIFARQQPGRQRRALSACQPCTLFPLLQGIGTSLTWRHPHPHADVRHAWAHTRQRWVKRRVSHLMKRHLRTNGLCLCRERPFYSAGQCLCWLFFVCTFLSTKSNRKTGERESEREREVRQACKHNHWHVQTYTGSRYLLNYFLFSNHVDLLHILWSG